MQYAPWHNMQASGYYFGPHALPASGSESMSPPPRRLNLPLPQSAGVQMPEVDTASARSRSARQRATKDTITVDHTIEGVLVTLDPA